jgi:hypothetical protein
MGDRGAKVRVDSEGGGGKRFAMESVDGKVV